MSKRALSLLLKEVTKKDDVSSIAGSSKAFRKELLDKNKQIFELGTVSYIANELRQEILVTEPTLLQGGLVTQQDLINAASALRNSFMARVKPDNVIDSSAGIVMYNTYDPMAKNLSNANKVAFNYLEQLVSGKNGSLGSLSPSLTSPDHVRASADIRFTQVFYNKLPNPTEALRALKDYGNLSQDSYSAFLTQYEEITSYYTKGEKIFDLSVGAELKLKSKKSNESAGDVTKAVTDSIRAAVNKAIVNHNWADQSGSDSYKDALFKELTNILVKGGATGKRQTVDASKNSVKQVNKQAIKVRKYKPGTPTKKLGNKKPLINLQAIVSYINSKLPEAVRANMGEPALVNRTGRFSNSARITGAQLTPQGYPSLSYTYQRSPYDVFDPFLGKKPWNTPGRNPRTLVEKSVRDVARDLAIGRFYLRRV